mmetsp:Transcript_75106/g.179285  ORF Transcript_75106/g.179285 Transcript_75106/m.179285 type:complete len:226 (+) Transcript_75106:5163-5840(+)
MTSSGRTSSSSIPRHDNFSITLSRSFGTSSGPRLALQGPTATRAPARGTYSRASWMWTSIVPAMPSTRRGGWQRPTTRRTSTVPITTAPGMQRTTPQLQGLRTSPRTRPSRVISTPLALGTAPSTPLGQESALTATRRSTPSLRRRRDGRLATSSKSSAIRWIPWGLHPRPCGRMCPCTSCMRRGTRPPWPQTSQCGRSSRRGSRTRAGSGCSSIRTSPRTSPSM